MMDVNKTVINTVLSHQFSQCGVLNEVYVDSLIFAIESLYL